MSTLNPFSINFTTALASAELKGVRTDFKLRGFEELLLTLIRESGYLIVQEARDSNQRLQLTARNRPLVRVVWNECKDQIHFNERCHGYMGDFIKGHNSLRLIAESILIIGSKRESGIVSELEVDIWARSKHTMFTGFWSALSQLGLVELVVGHGGDELRRYSMTPLGTKVINADRFPLSVTDFDKEFKNVILSGLNIKLKMERLLDGYFQ